eukprot:m.266443 g.266443  ORF g.266443 m.266443 type:complete len:73 (-) comp30783_c0_seq1:264-482(-)
MARGQQKIQAQQKAAQKAAKGKKKVDNKAAQARALNIACQVCKAQMTNPKMYKQHFEAKHPKSPLPAELKDV